MKEEVYRITYRNVIYQLDTDFWLDYVPETTMEFQLAQLQYCIDTGDFLTLENRITNMLMWGGIKEVKK